MKLEPGMGMSDAGRLVPRKALEGRLDSFVLKRMDQGRQEFVVREVAPRLTWNRLDLAIKLFYLEQLAAGRSSFAEELYDAHIHAFSLGNFRESGNDAKVDAATFRSAFAGILESLRTEGFDPERSLIPVASDGSFINGGHRTACAMFLQRNVHVVETGLRPVRYDYDYFRRRGMDDALLEAAVLKYLERCERADLALVWSGGNAAGGVERLFGPLIYSKRIALSPNGTANLRALLGGGGASGQAAPSHPSGGSASHVAPDRSEVRLYAYEAVEDDEIAMPQQKLRSLATDGRQQVHLPASRGDSLDLARLLLNERSLRFLDMAHPNRLPASARMAGRFREVLDRSGVPREMVVLGPGMVLAAFGVREAAEVDVMSLRPLGADPGTVPVRLRPCGPEIQDILQDPRRHFHYRGLKFLSVTEALAEAGARQSAEAAEEMRLLASLKARAEPRRPARRLVYRARLISSMLRHSAIQLARALGLREPATLAYRVLRRRR